MQPTPLPRKSLGQHWLFDESALQAMVDAAAISSTDTVLEVGPGLGTLTSHLVKAAKQVIAVEFDRELAQALPAAIPANNLVVHNEDILQFDLSALPPDYKVAANIPYYLTSHLLRLLSEASNSPAAAALLVQKEVAERVTATAGGMSVLSVAMQYYFETNLGMVVPAALFSPPPKVDSQILILVRRSQPLFADVDSKKFFRLVKAGFGEKRKKLSNSLAGGLHLGKDEAAALLHQAGINPDLRAQALTLEDWRRLYQTQTSN